MNPCVLLFIVISCTSASRNQKPPSVKIPQGALSGTFLKTQKGRVIMGFMNIPYAVPPVGQLRFEPPVPAGPWKGTLNATKTNVMCPQKQVYVSNQPAEGEEDCLYINVYTPGLPDSRKSLPVMVYIHGGGYSTASGSYDSYRPDILLDHDVVFVAFNYRLGILGFLTTSDAVAPGNNGLKDQNLAIRWVKSNIEYFGGDPQIMTVFGESAGSICVHLQMLSPLGKGLFHRAISESGTSLNGWTFDSGQQVDQYSKQVASAVGCPTDSSQSMVDCLRTIDAHKLIYQYDMLREWDIDPSILFKPVIEPDLPGAFLTKHPKDIIRSGNFSQVPWILGINTEEGCLRASGANFARMVDCMFKLVVLGIYSKPNLVAEYDRDFYRIAPISLVYEFARDPDHISRRIREFYFGNKRIDNSTRLNFIDMYTDARFLSGVDDAVTLHTTSTKQTVFYYLFGHRGVSSYSELWGGGSENFGVCHCDELQHLFPLYKTTFRGKPPDVFDVRISETLTTLWTSFAKTGIPKPDRKTLAFSPPWHPVRSKTLEFYYVGSNTHMTKNMLSKRVDFWRSLSTSLDRFM